MRQPSIAKLKALPQRSHEVWQGGLFRMPGWVTGEDRAPYRPYMPLWVSKHENKLYADPLTRPEQRTLAQAVDALLAFACASQWGGYRPGAIEVNDSALGEHLSGLLADTGIEVRVTERLDAIEQALDELREYHGITQSDHVFAGMISGNRVTIEHLRRFAAAAAAFYAAAPWQHLTEIDLVKIIHPSPPPSMRYATVLGGTRTLRGMALYASVEQFTTLYKSAPEPGRPTPEMSGFWQMGYSRIHELVPRDADAWEDHQLAAADPDAYPVLIGLRARPPHSAPDAAQLDFATHVLNALAASTETQIDMGQWHVEVPAPDNDRHVKLEMPDLLTPPTLRQWAERGIAPDPRSMEHQLIQIETHFTRHPPNSVEEANRIMAARFLKLPPQMAIPADASDHDRARGMCYQGFETHGRRRVQLAHAALELWAECPEAYLILAETAGTAHAEMECYRRSMEFAERDLGPKVFRESMGRFFAIASTRTYMRARLGYALSLKENGQVADCIEHLQTLIELSDNDNLGVRYLLLTLFLATQRDGDAAKLLADVDEDSVVWAYARALLAFRLSDRPETARHEIHAAFRRNPAMAALLLEEVHGPGPDVYPADAIEEARVHLDDIAPAIRATPGALDWLDEEYVHWIEVQYEQTRKQQREKQAAARKKANRKKKK